MKKLKVVNARSTVEKYVLRQSLMDLPYFDGNHKVWPRFKQTFIETRKGGIFSDLENSNRLQKKPERRCIEGSQFTLIGLQ